MSKVDLASKQWCELVFEGRNKEYGAYRARANKGKFQLRSILILLGLIAAVGIIVFTKSAVEAAIAANKNLDDENVTELSQLKKDEPKKEEKKKEPEIKYEEPKVEKVMVKSSIQFTVPKITADEQVDHTKELKTQDEVQKSSFAIASQDYAGDGKGGINIDDLRDDQQAGGTSPAPKEQEVLSNELVEQKAEYPGGEAAILRFIAENLVYPQKAQEEELQGVVRLRFKVEKDGSVGQVVIQQGLSAECDQAAIAVVKKLKRFTPARQQGHPVPVWFTLPIRFRIQ